MSVKDDLREQFTEAFEGADYPVNNQMDLVPALPDGPSTKFTSDDVSLTAMELATKLGSEANFPYEDVDSLVEDVMSALEEEDIV
ncbi:Uncharacterized protein HSRCO_1211 [Halanaeroarchaeum sp. HSR-CO]|uniref:MTH865 family protein n=1 Tax=Halanaeroarchaeum sp. HSR-CO TaxID=2866382 RepID=UPI00217E92CF|nr:MTH865 family protein [Halanaeroarchaeum sp. HSR-CO]UWG47497.1 Uncharacterized protein HSRCO_1211 [Halanaeroarchaeum sp. HSR-CO]